MAFSSLFTLLDDIASLLDDVSVMTKVAAKKTVGVVGDDLALNANQVTGATAERELPKVRSKSLVFLTALLVDDYFYISFYIFCFPYILLSC